MATLIERLRAARETWTTVGQYEFLLRRPTALQVARWRDEAEVSFLGRVIVGWKGVRELDLVPGGEGSPVPFDAGLCVEWIEDKPEIYTALMAEVNRILEAHWHAREDAAGK